MNNRRKVLIALGAGACAAPLESFAQQPAKVWRVGYLSLGARPTSLDASYFGAFQSGMRELGYVEGKNLAIEWRFAEGRSELLPILAAEMVTLKVDVIVAGSTQATSAAKKATAMIPILMVNITDPVGSGFVKSLAHPEGNITGLSNLNLELGLKRLEMLLSVVPKLSGVAVLVHPDSSSNIKSLERIQSEGMKHHVKILAMEARTPSEIDNAFSSMRQRNAGALIVSLNSIFQQQKIQIVGLAARYRLPSVAAHHEYVEAGGLMSYGTNQTDIFRRAATYIDKIFKGAKAGDIPVEQPTKFEMFINGKTAKTLGLTIPQSLLIMADKVIE